MGIVKEDAERDQRLAVASLLQRAGKRVEAVVSGGSMEPTIPRGTQIRIDCSQLDFSVGDVVSFIAGKNLISHRVVYRGKRGRARGYIITRGDGTWLCDPPAAADTVLGVVREKNRGEGWEALPNQTFAKPSLLSRAATLVNIGLLEIHVRLAQYAFTIIPRVRSLFLRNAGVR